MAVDLFRAAAPAALATCTGIALGYFVYKQFIDKWYGQLRIPAIVTTQFDRS